jgi:RHS repeat-associated protein
MPRSANPRAGGRSRVSEPVRFARNAALLSGIAAAGVIAVGLLVGNVVVIGLGLVSLWLALAGVMLWARRERRRALTTKVVSEGLPGEEESNVTYDENGRLAKAAGTKYEYDADNNLTRIDGSSYTYDDDDELETGSGAEYTYNEVGERTKTEPASGPATSYGYNMAGELTAVSRPKEGETSAIEDSYTYDGEGLRASQTTGGSTTYFTWDVDEEVPVIINDGAYSYIYGPNGLPVEQISSGGEVLYIHHDQQGSTRMLTNSSGTVEGSFTYSPYGELSGSSGGKSTRLGYDGQYTDDDTGLIYMRARYYDPKTAQFLTVDPIVGITEAPYCYAGDNPLDETDPTGLRRIQTLSTLRRYPALYRYQRIRMRERPPRR